MPPAIRLHRYGNWRDRPQVLSQKRPKWEARERERQQTTWKKKEREKKEKKNQGPTSTLQSEADNWLPCEAVSSTDAGLLCCCCRSVIHPSFCGRFCSEKKRQSRHDTKNLPQLSVPDPTIYEDGLACHAHDFQLNWMYGWMLSLAGPSLSSRPTAMVL